MSEMSTELVVFTGPTSSKPKRAYVTTPFQAHKFVNAAFREAGINKQIPPQMLYNYAAKGKFEIGYSEDGRKVVDRDSFANWFATYFVGACRRAA
jgi:hypothetical protein